MNSRQKNKFNAYVTTEAFLTDNPVTSEVPAFPASFTAFQTELNALRPLLLTQAKPLSAAIADRNDALKAAEAAGLAVAGIALSYAHANKLNSLADRVLLRPGDFTGVRLTQRVQLVQQLHDAVLPVVPQLADRGVTAATMDDLKAKLAAAQAALSTPRQTTAEKAAATERLRAAFRAVDAVLTRQLDPVLLPLRDTHPEFYARYKRVRAVVDRPGSRGAGTDEGLTEIASPATSSSETPTIQRAA